MRGWALTLTGLLWVAGLGMTSAVASADAAPSVQCGDVITAKHTVLDGNLECWDKVGLIVGRSNVTLDLNGYRISGGGGIRIENVNNVAVANGAINLGETLDGPNMLVYNVSNLSVRNVTFDGCCPQTLRIAESRKVRIDGNVFGDVEVQLRGTHNSAISNNWMRGSNDFALSLWESNNNAITNNTLSHNEIGGVSIYSGSRNVIRENVATSNTWVGIYLAGAADSTSVDGNTVFANQGDGIRADSATTMIRNNTANDNGLWGIIGVPGVTDGGGNRASGNGSGQCAFVVCSP
jgi:parallel beta-helix repeat protein